ncbi:transposable element Tcb2 transposase [Trichonephila clavipes]|nr:transposable element Tcb2 transposase [Trichonephila clavipes]
MANNQSVRRHLDAFTRGRIIGKLEEGCSVTSVAAEFELLTASFHDFGDNFKLQEQLSGGSVVVVHEKPHPHMTGTLSYRPEETGGRQRGEIADTRHRRLTTDRVLPWARRLHGGGLLARRPVRCVPLTPAHRRRRSLWCREHRNWRDNEWRRVLFTDESRFSLSSDSHRILIWRAGSRNHPSNIIKRGHVWRSRCSRLGGIMLGSRTDSSSTQVQSTGPVIVTRFFFHMCVVFLEALWVCSSFSWRQCTMSSHSSCRTALLESEDIECMDWPARSPDLNFIEHVWDFLGQTLGSSYLTNSNDSGADWRCKDEWAAMPQQLIDTLILSMGRRCETCLAVREIISPTKDRMFLAGHPSQGCFAFSRIALHATFSIKLLFIPPLISL